ncbi:MAG: DNA repair protein RecO [Clostridia bacterium]|nr:DNA repair protein RecO [Clostridia bacterium]
MLYTLKGLVLRENVAGDNARYINLLTAERGRLSVLVRGSAKSRGKFTAPTQIFCYSEMVLYEHNGKYTLNDASLIENYFYLCSDFDTMTLGTYVLNAAEYVTSEEQPEEEILRLTLNTLWALSHRRERDLRLIKGAFELRLAALAGFAPNLVCCQGCGCGVGEDRLHLNVMEGTLLCEKCVDRFQKEVYMENDILVDENRTAQIILPLDPAVVLAMQYALYVQPNKLFSFTLAQELIPQFSHACEKYLENHVDHHFQVLDMLTFS